MNNRYLACLALGTLLLVLAAPPATADTVSLFDWAFNVNGTAYKSPGPYSGPDPGQLPAYFDTSAFDWATGLGTITLDYRPGAGSYFFIGFLDLEIDNAINGPYNEYSPDPDTAKLAAGQTWEVDEPGWNLDPSFPMGDIYWNATGLTNALDNSNGLPITNPYNVSMALGWNFTLPPGKRAIITLSTTTSGPPASGFFLEQRDLDSPGIVYYSGNVSGSDIPGGGGGGVPEPGTLVLLGSGLAGLALLARGRRSGAKARNLFHLALIVGLISLPLIVPQTASATAPVVKTVQFVPDKPTATHPAMCGVPLTLKGTSDQGGTWSWDPADGSGALYSGTISNMYAIEATHTYSGAGCSAGKIYAASLTVTNTGGEFTTKYYYVQIFDKTLDVEVNRAIDEGLWALQKGMTRSINNGLPDGDWSSWSGYYGVHAANTEAFFSMGFKENGTADNPYTETVQRAMNHFFTLLNTYSISRGDMGGGVGYGVGPNQSYQGYQDGMMLSALVASGNPDGIAPTGILPSGSNPGIKGRKYKDIAQDMVDYIAGCQYADSNYGGWRYNCGDFPDNSACQWNAIALIAAERIWGLQIAPYVKPNNKNWLVYSHNATSGPYGWYGYTSTGYGWGPFADTASGMVQAIMDGYGRDDQYGLWNSAEAFMRDQWDNPGGYSYGGTGFRYYYVYATFSFVKSMLLHSPQIDGKINKLHSYSGIADLDWYGDPVKGVARALLDAQYAPPQGYWWSKYGQPTGDHYPFMTAWAIMMLNRTVIETGKPVAVAKALPPVAVKGQTVTLDGGGSYHQDPSKSIVAWDWTIYDGPDIGSGVLATKSGKTVTFAFPDMKNYLVKLTVTDNASPPATAEAFFTVQVSIPPIAPVAIAGGPYKFCNQAIPWVLDGSRSYNPDDGAHQPGNYPGDFITAYLWDLDLNGAYDNASGAKPNVTSYFSGKAPGSYLIGLKVEDNTALSFPDVSGGKNLFGTATATVVLEGNCGCITNLTAKTMGLRVDLAWQNIGAEKYNIYRKLSTDADFPAAPLATVNAPVGVFSDLAVVAGKTYNYVVRPYKSTNTPPEYCTSNMATALVPAFRR